MQCIHVPSPQTPLSFVISFCIKYIPLRHQSLLLSTFHCLQCTSPPYSNPCWNASSTDFLLKGTSRIFGAFNVHLYSSADSWVSCRLQLCCMNQFLHCSTSLKHKQTTTKAKQTSRCSLSWWQFLKKLQNPCTFRNSRSKFWFRPFLPTPYYQCLKASGFLQH